MLEIGLAQGKSLQFWKEYFPCATIFGLEYSPASTQEWKQYESLDNRVRIVQGDQSSIRDLRRLRDIIGVWRLHLIVDDGGHTPLQQTTSYEFMFDELLAPGGHYIIEDIETSWWKDGTKLYGPDRIKNGKN